MEVGIKVYLKSSISAEPRMWGWYAWSYLIPPVTAACNIAQRHIKIMESYIESPQVHLNAATNPKLIGGPFINLDESYVEVIKKLIEDTRLNCAELLELEGAIKETDLMLQEKAQGGSVEEIYQELPNILKGLVEIVYDLNSHPSLRLIEPLIYHKHNTKSYQTLFLSEIKSDTRPFSLSTPFVRKSEGVELKIPYSDKRLDTLFSMRTKPTLYGEIERLLEISDSDKLAFRNLFTDSNDDSNGDQEYQSDEIRLRYFGHACVLLQTKKCSILIDPVISYKYENQTTERFTIDDLPKTIDYVLITHNHQDHLHIETLLAIRYKVKNIIVPQHQPGFLADPSLKLILQQLGFDSVILVDELDSIDIPDGRITFLPFLGEHSDLNVHSKIAHLVELQGKKFLFAADSNNISPDMYKHYREILGDADVLFIGMECDGAPLSWLYGPFLSTPLKRSLDYSRTLSGSDCKKALSIVETFNFKEVYVYAMGREPWLSYIMGLHYTKDSPQIIESDKLMSICKERNIISARPYGKMEIIYTKG